MGCSEAPHGSAFFKETNTPICTQQYTHVLIIKYLLFMIEIKYQVSSQYKVLEAIKSGNFAPSVMELFPHFKQEKPSCHQAIVSFCLNSPS